MHSRNSTPAYPALEFNHSFINAVVRENAKDLGSAERVFKPVATQMQSLAYDNPETMVDESLVRAAVILYFQSHGSALSPPFLAREKPAHGSFVARGALPSYLAEENGRRDMETPAEPLDVVPVQPPLAGKDQ